MEDLDVTRRRRRNETHAATDAIDMPITTNTVYAPSATGDDDGMAIDAEHADDTGLEKREYEDGAHVAEEMAIALAAQLEREAEAAREREIVTELEIAAAREREIREVAAQLKVPIN